MLAADCPVEEHASQSCLACLQVALDKAASLGACCPLIGVHEYHQGPAIPCCLSYSVIRSISISLASGCLSCCRLARSAVPCMRTGSPAVNAIMLPERLLPKAIGVAQHLAGLSLSVALQTTPTATSC